MSDVLLHGRGIAKAYPSGSGRIEVLRDLDLEIRIGEAVAVVGDSGVGKSTLLHILGGLDRPDAGEIRFRGRTVPFGDVRAMSRYRNESVGFVFQFHHLLPEFTAVENVEMPFRIGRRSGNIREQSLDSLRRLGLAARVDHRPGAMSGGEQQRVAIARAVAPRPDLVLADEPTGNLDPATGMAVFENFRRLQSERSFSLVLATHSERLARGCDRILRLESGRLRALAVAEANDYFDGVVGS